MKIGRNDPCHCGSGKKYKKCHGGAAEAAVVAEVSKIGPQWVQRHLTALFKSAQEKGSSYDERPLYAQTEFFDLEVGLSESELNSKDKKQRELFSNLKQSLSQSALEPFEVTEIRRGYGLKLKGVCSGRTLNIDQPEDAERLEPMQWIYGRVAIFGRKAYLLEGWLLIPFKRRKPLRRRLIAHLESSPISQDDLPKSSQEAELEHENPPSQGQPSGSSPSTTLNVPLNWLKQNVTSLTAMIEEEIAS